MTRFSAAAALVACAGLDSHAAAQAPAVVARVLVHDSAQGPAASRIPAGFGVRTAARIDDHRVMVEVSSTNRCFVADGAGVEEVMIRGTQIPGQAPGVVWDGAFRAACYPIDGRGMSFSARAMGPAIGDTPQYVSFVGEVDASLDMNPSILNQPLPCTRSGLILRLDPSVAVGPIGGTMQTVLPAAYQPPGASGPRSYESNGAHLNQAGRASITFRSSGSNRSYVVVADTRSIEVRAEGRTVLQTDRGALPLNANIYAISQPHADGSVFVQGSVQGDDTRRQIVWLAPSSGPASMVAMTGDRAPGTEPGVTFATSFNTFEFYGANRNGSLLFRAALTGPDGPGQALYLWRRGALTLVARHTAEFSLSPGTAPSRSLNSNDEVGFIGETQAFIYKPGVGTVTVARRGEPINPSSGLVGDVVSTYPFFGSTFGGVHDSGNDDISVPCLTEDGRLFIVGTALRSSPPGGGNFFATFEISSPGCPSDFNLDGFTDFFDYVDFVTCFEGGRCPDGKPADFNDDGIADFFDYMEFVEAFETGCG